MKRALLACSLFLLASPAATASIEVARNAQRPALRVDARGWAEVSWTAGGARKTVLVPPSGKLVPGGRLRRTDVSRASAGPTLPFQSALRRTPDGRLWALQAWSQGDGPVQLRFSRWRGAPTQVTATIPGGNGPLDRLLGRATFAGRPVTGTSPTPGGAPVRHVAWIECFACLEAPGWRSVTSVPPDAADGSFLLLLRPAWSSDRYRVSIVGPNRGATYAPDASVIADRTGIEPAADR